MEKNKVYCIDVVEGLDKLDEKFDIILADPPYNIGKNFGNYKDNLKFEEYIEWSLEWINRCENLLKDSGTMYIYGFTEILAHISVKINLPHRWLIWHYTNKTTPSSSFWQRSHESIIVMWKDKDKRIFNLDDVREEYTSTFLKNANGKIRKNTEGRFSRKDSGKETYYKAHEKGAMPRDVLKIPALAGGAGKKERIFLCKDCEVVSFNKKEHENHNIIKHPTQKPFKVTERIIKASKPEKDGLVLIPFSGSGSECYISKKLGLDFIGFDINPDYVKLGNEWIKN